MAKSTAKGRMWALSNLEIDRYFRATAARAGGVPRYLGTYAKDQIPAELAKKKQGALTINLGNAETGGTHWVAILMNKKNTIYFDSYGCEPPVQVLNFMRKRKLPTFYCDRQLQHLKSSSCGWFCVFFIQQCVINNPNRDILEVIPMFTFSPAKNEKILNGILLPYRALFLE